MKRGSISQLDIGPLMGGGLVLGYRCGSHCQHCLYGCGPHRTDGGLTDETELSSLLDQLAERAGHAQFHIGGGEPFLNLDLLEEAVDGMIRRGLILDYVETNASWLKSEEQAEAVLTKLANRGLECVLVSLSPFHAEFVPMSRTLGLIRMARRTLARGAFVWMPEFIQDLKDEPQDRKINLDDFIAEHNPKYALSLASRYSLVPAGRAGRFVHRYGAKYQWQDLAKSINCRMRLQDTSHFHVDLQGFYVPGLCPGLVFRIEEVPGRIDLHNYPIINALVNGGPADLFEIAAGQGFAPLDTYGSACDFCTHMRQFLYHCEAYAELGPKGYYDVRSIDFSR